MDFSCFSIIFQVGLYKTLHHFFSCRLEIHVVCCNQPWDHDSQQVSMSTLGNSYPQDTQRRVIPLFLGDSAMRLYMFDAVSQNILHTCNTCQPLNLLHTYKYMYMYMSQQFVFRRFLVGQILSWTFLCISFSLAA